MIKSTVHRNVHDIRINNEHVSVSNNKRLYENTPGTRSLQ